MGRPIMYSPDVREWALRMVSEHRGDPRSECVAICSIAGVVDPGDRPGQDRFSEHESVDSG